MSNLPVRDRTDAMVLGVCSALARAWGIDPLVVRVAFVGVGLMTNGFALAVYAILWAILPERGGVAPLHRLVPATRSWSWGTLATVALLVTAVAAALSGSGPGAFVIFLLAWLILRFGFAGRVPGSSPQPAPAPLPTPQTPFERAAQAWQLRLANVEAGRPADWVPDVDEPPTPAREPRTPRRGLRTWLGILVALGAAWSLLAVLEAVDVVVPPLAWWSATLLVLGAALVVTARPGRRAWGRPVLLLPLALVSALGTLVLVVPSEATQLPGHALGVTAPSTDGPLVELPAGEHTVDLSGGSAPTEDTHYWLPAGQLTVVVPLEGNVVVRAHAAVGDVTTPSGSDGGFGVDREWRRVVDPDQPTLTIDVSVGVGEVVVTS